MMNVHFWFHALSEIPDIIVWIKNGQHLEVRRYHVGNRLEPIQAFTRYDALVLFLQQLFLLLRAGMSQNCYIMTVGVSTKLPKYEIKRAGFFVCFCVCFTAFHFDNDTFVVCVTLNMKLL